MRIGRSEDVLDALKPGMRVFVQGASGENLALIDLLRAAPEKLAGVELWSTLVPGVNAFDYGSLHPDIRFITFMASPALAPSIAAGSTQIRNQPYSAMARTLSETPFDLTLIQTAPPDTNGMLSFGVASDFAPIVCKHAARIFAFANERMQAPPRAASLNTGDIDTLIPIDAPLIETDAGKPPSDDLLAIGRHAAALISDGATIQSGIGQAPGAVLSALTGHRDLRIHSGMVIPEHRLLADAGALGGSDHLTGIALGDAGFYRWIAESDFCRFADVLETHGAGALAATPNFTSINTALEIDLTGAINIEWLGDRRISGLGGAPDFMAAAAMSPGGRSIIALPAASRGASRIVARLDPSRVSMDGGLTDCVVTPYGAAQVKGLSGDARARALIAIAAPEHRDALEHDWRTLR